MPRPMVDAEPVRAHLNRVLRYTTRQQLSEATGVSINTLNRVLNPKCKKTRAGTAETILAQTPGDRRLGQFRITCREQLDEFMHLYNLGVSVHHAAKQIGLHPKSLGNMFKRCGVELPRGVADETWRSDYRGQREDVA